MSSLFQGLVEPDGRVKVTTSATGAVPLRGLMVSPDGRVLIAEDTGQARVHHSGRAFDPATGALLVDPAAVTEVRGMGGLTVDINGGVITKGVVPDVIHQGVGLTSEGYLAIDRGSPEDSIFYAPLSSNLNEVVAGLTPIYSRPLEALYEPTPGQWAIAAADEPRFESGHLLVEPAATNVNINYNANPDPGLSGIFPGGGAVITRVNDAAAIAASGLASICTDGNVIDCDNSGGGGPVSINFNQNVSDTAASFSCFGRRISGAGVFRVGNSTMVPHADITGTDRYERAGVVGTIVGSGQLSVQLGAGVHGRVILNGLVEESVLSTPIITRGASASRSVDQLRWAGMNGFFPDTQGMVMCDWRPKHLKSEIPVGDRALVSRGTTFNLLYNDTGALKAYDGASTGCSIGLPASWVIGDSIRCINTYGPGLTASQIVGLYFAGSGWSWDPSPCNYIGNWAPGQDELWCRAVVSYPTWMNSITLWDENKGQAWVEANLTP